MHLCLPSGLGGRAGCDGNTSDIFPRVVLPAAALVGGASGDGGAGRNRCALGLRGGRRAGSASGFLKQSRCGLSCRASAARSKCALSPSSPGTLTPGERAGLSRRPVRAGLRPVGVRLPSGVCVWPGQGGPWPPAPCSGAAPGLRRLAVSQLRSSLVTAAPAPPRSCGVRQAGWSVPPAQAGTHAEVAVVDQLATGASPRCFRASQPQCAPLECSPGLPRLPVSPASPPGELIFLQNCRGRAPTMGVEPLTSQGESSPRLISVLP